jgi:hypothetical protein
MVMALLWLFICMAFIVLGVVSKRKLLWILGAILLCIGVATAALMFNDPIDRCLDAGGAWNYSQSICRVY